MDHMRISGTTSVYHELNNSAIRIVYVLSLLCVCFCGSVFVYYLCISLCKETLVFTTKYFWKYLVWLHGDCGPTYDCKLE